VTLNSRRAEMHGVPVEAHIGRKVADVLQDRASQIEPNYGAPPANARGIEIEQVSQLSYWHPKPLWWAKTRHPRIC
jgi:hypothetical protein